MDVRVFVKTIVLVLNKSGVVEGRSEVVVEKEVVKKDMMLSKKYIAK